jgi:TolB-like protein
LAVQYANTNQPKLASEYAEKAFALRDRVSELEKLRISNFYYAFVTGEIDKQIEVLELYKKTYPRDSRASSNLSDAYTRIGQFEKAAAEAHEAIRLNPNGVVGYANLAQAFLNLSRFADAKEVVEQASHQNLDSTLFHNYLYRVASVAGDAAAMQQQLEWRSAPQRKHGLIETVLQESNTALAEMGMSGSEPAGPESLVFQFGEFVLHVPAYELRKGGQPLTIERRPMDLLILLVSRRGDLITRDEIVDHLWGRDVFIDIDTSINTVIRKIRRALGDSADDSRYILTVQGKGYRCIAEVETITPCAVLAVLPFENLKPSRDQDCFADGLTEEAIVALGQIDPERLSVIGRTSSMVYRGTKKAIREIGCELGPDYVLENSIRAEYGHFRIICRLIRVHDQVPIWTECYDRESKDLLGLQTELGRTIAQEFYSCLSSKLLPWSKP